MTFTPIESLPFPKGLGYRQDEPDRRDRVLFKSTVDFSTLPATANCESILPRPLDQDITGSCVGFALSNMFHGVMERVGHRRPYIPSQPFIYREARVLGGYVEEDFGCEIRNGMKAANKFGLPPMSNIPPRFGAADLADPKTGIFPGNSIWRRQPAPSHYADGERRQVIAYYRLETLGDLLKCLSESFPAVFGLPIHYSFYNRDTGMPRYHIPDPVPMQDYILGYHAVCGFGYDMNTGRVFIRNSWGDDPHEGKPNFTLSFDYVSRFVTDMWTTRFIEGGKV